MSDTPLFTRHPRNPILTAKCVPNAACIMNSAVVKFGKAYAGVFRVENTELSMELHAGTSTDGLNWKLDPKPIHFAGAYPKHLSPGRGYDPRITKIGGVYYVTWCYYPCGQGPAIGMARTTDFKKFFQMAEVILPFNRNAVLFPRKIDGKYAILHRPSDNGHTPFGDVYYASSPDLIHWGDHKFVFGPTTGWQGTKVGAGPTPIETKDGWVLLYHGVITNCNGFVYSMGGAILDLKSPWKIKYRTKRYMMTPEENYERVGFVPNVVFPTATLFDEKTRKLDVFYGAADTCIGLASANFDEVVKFIKKTS
jgi:beta-1,4-mannooligosaccharide/beta-1,4-mannosyl-N-acetylglucosamine phosphorylase